MLHEKLSAYMDNETSAQEDRLVEQLTNDKELIQKWQNYHLIKDVMQKENIKLLSDDFALKMEAIIDMQEFDLATENSEKIETVKISALTKLIAKSKDFMAKFGQGMFTQGLITASVCLVAVLSFQHFTKEDSPTIAKYSATQTLPFNQNIAPVSLKLNNNIEINNSEKIEQAQQRLEMMLKNYEFTRRINNN